VSESSGCQSVRNVFICSAGHSGSTLLDMILGSHSSAESLGELGNLPMDMALNRRCTCGSLIRDCRLWSEVMRKMGVDTAIDPYSLNLGYNNPKVGDVKKTSSLHRIVTRPKIAIRYLHLRYNIPLLASLTPGFDAGIANSLAVYDQVRALTRKSVVIDSSKHYVRGVSIYLSAPKNTRIIILVRDGRGVFYSNLKRGFGLSYSLRAWYNHYKHTFEIAERRVPGEHRTVVHYEDMVTDPRTTFIKLCDFLDLNFEPSMLEFRGTPHHNVNGNDVKFSSISKLVLDESWRTGLKAADLAYFEKRAGALNRALGYV
jgi:hypothetical protein